MRTYTFAIEIKIELPDLKEGEEEHCCVGLGNASGHCGGECGQYFFGILKNWINRDEHTPSITFEHSSIERVDEDEELPTDPEFLAIKDKSFDELVAESEPLSEDMFEWMKEATEGVTCTDEDFE